MERMVWKTTGRIYFESYTGENQYKLNMVKRFWYWLFPEWECKKYVRGQWNLHVSTDLFGDYNETKYCYFWIQYSKRRNRYKLEMNGYKPQDHNLCDELYNMVIELNGKK